MTPLMSHQNQEGAVAVVVDILGKWRLNLHLVDRQSARPLDLARQPLLESHKLIKHSGHVQRNNRQKGRRRRQTYSRGRFQPPAKQPRYKLLAVAAGSVSQTGGAGQRRLQPGQKRPGSEIQVIHTLRRRPASLTRADRQSFLRILPPKQFSGGGGATQLIHHVLDLPQREESAHASHYY